MKRSNNPTNRLLSIYVCVKGNIGTSVSTVHPLVREPLEHMAIDMAVLRFRGETNLRMICTRIRTRNIAPKAVVAMGDTRHVFSC